MDELMVVDSDVKSIKTDINKAAKTAVADSVSIEAAHYKRIGMDRKSFMTTRKDQLVNLAKELKGRGMALFYTGMEWDGKSFSILMVNPDGGNPKYVHNAMTRQKLKAFTGDIPTKTLEKLPDGIGKHVYVWSEGSDPIITFKLKVTFLDYLFPWRRKGYYVAIWKW